MSTKPRRIRRRPEVAETEILNAAAQLLEDLPFRDLSVSAVMANTGMKRPAFYNYFNDLNAVIVSLLARIEGEMMEASEIWFGDHEGGPANLHSGLEAAIGVFSRHGHVIAAAHAASYHDETVEGYYRHGFLQAFIEGVAIRIRTDNDAGRADVPDPEAVAKALVLMNATFLAEVFGQPLVPSDQAAPATRATLLIWERTIYGSETRARTSN